jgi:hypothetical protein
MKREEISIRRSKIHRGIKRKSRLAEFIMASDCNYDRTAKLRGGMAKNSTDHHSAAGRDAAGREPEIWKL